MARDDMAHDEPQRTGDDTTLQGRTAVVTGASSGIGRAIALQLCEAGADVLIHARTSVDRAEAVAQQVRTMGRRSTVLLADLSDPAAAETFVQRAWDWCPEIGIWINNAGGDVLTGTAADWSFDQKLDYLWRVDVRGTIQLSRLVGQHMLAANPSDQDYSIINMGWDQAESGMGGDSGEMFAAVKGAIMSFTRSLAHSLAPRVRVNCLAPGWIRTAWGADAQEYWQQRASTESLMQRWGTPDDVAGTTRFLVSPAARFITGQTIAINGGRCGR